jgi:hypothetical protein
MAQEKTMELYTNSSWTQRYDDVYVAEALAWSENANHLTIYATGSSAEEAQSKLTEGLGELKLIPQARNQRMVREGISPQPRNADQNHQQEKATPSTDLDRLEQAVDQILAEVRAPA